MTIQHAAFGRAAVPPPAAQALAGVQGSLPKARGVVELVELA